MSGGKGGIMILDKRIKPIIEANSTKEITVPFASEALLKFIRVEPKRNDLVYDFIVYGEDENIKEYSQKDFQGMIFDVVDMAFKGDINFKITNKSPKKLEFELIRFKGLMITR